MSVESSWTPYLPDDIAANGWDCLGWNDGVIVECPKEWRTASITRQGWVLHADPINNHPRVEGPETRQEGLDQLCAEIRRQRTVVACRVTLESLTHDLADLAGLPEGTAPEVVLERLRHLLARLLRPEAPTITEEEAGAIREGT